MTILSDDNLKNFSKEQLIIYIRGLHELINNIKKSTVNLLCDECCSFSNSLENCYFCGSNICESCKKEKAISGENYKCCPLCD
jgi:hypothetical protein